MRKRRKKHSLFVEKQKPLSLVGRDDVGHEKMHIHHLSSVPKNIFI
jgi:hypothetical protein